MKYRVLVDWDIEGKKGPKKGEILEISSSCEVYDDNGNFDMWIVHYKGEYYEVFPYEVEEVK